MHIKIAEQRMKPQTEQIRARRKSTINAACHDESRTLDEARESLDKARKLSPKRIILFTQWPRSIV